MARVKSGVPTVKELKEGELEHRYVSGTGLVGYTRYENQLYSSKMYPSSVPPIIDKKARSIIRSSDTVNIITGELDLDFGSIVPGVLADGDHMLFLDATASNEVRKEAFADLSTLLSGDGLQSSSSVMALDLKSNGGIVIESNEAAVDLGASSITGTLAVGDGGTGLTTITDGAVMLGSGSSAVTPLAVTTNGAILIGDGTTDPTTYNAFSSSTGTLNVSAGGTGAASFTTNAILTGNGSSAIQAEASLLFTSQTVYPTATAHDTAGKTLTVSAGDTTSGTTNNIAGGALTFQGGQGKGSGAGGDIIFQTANAGSSGSSINALSTALTLSDDLSATFTGSIDVDGTSNLDDVDIDGDVDISGALTLSAEGDGALQFANAGENSIRIPDNQTNALIIEEAGNRYMTFTTTNSGEKVTCNKHLYVATLKDQDVSQTSSGSGYQLDSDEDIELTVRQDDGGSAGDHLIDFKDSSTSFLTFTYTSNLATMKTGGSAVDLTLDSRGGQFNFNDDTATHFLLDCDNTKMVIYDDQDTGDYFQIQVAQHGATTLTTVDDDAAAADLILSPDGSIELNAAYTELKAMDFDVALQATDPESGSGKIFGSGFADYYTNYVWLGMWDLQPSAEYDTDFGSW